MASSPAKMPGQSLTDLLVVIAVDDLHSGVHWVQYVPSRVARGREWGNVRTRDISTGELVQIEQAAAHGTRIRAQAVWRGHPFHVVFELDTEDPVLTVAIDTLDRENSSITTRSTARDAGLRPKWTVVSEIKGS